MKKTLSLGLAIATMASTLAGCNLFGSNIGKIALVTDVGSIDDRSFNQGTWEGLVAFAEERNLVEDEDYKYFVPEGGETAGTAQYIAAIELAIEWGAETVITPGFLFEEAIYTVQEEYPDVKFVLLDGEPHDAAYTYETLDNTLPILFQEEQSGFLAGYGAVKEGLDVPAFIGGMAVPAVVKFGIGFVAGAYFAAEEEGLTTFEFDPENYWYSGVFWPDPSVVTRSALMYSDAETGGKADVIFVAAGGAGSSVIAEATNADKWMIGVDIDQGPQSELILTSAMKGLGSAVIIALESIEDGEFNGGETLRLGASNDGVGLPLTTESWRFEVFTKTEYTAILGKLADGTVEVPADFAELDAFVEDTGLAFNFVEADITGAA